MDNKGYIKLYRKLTEWEWFTDETTLQVFIYLLLSANYEDKMWRGKLIKRGQMITSTNHIELATGKSRYQVERALKNLVSSGNITKISTTQYTLINIVKYEDFQDSFSNETNNELTYELAYGLTTTKEEKKINKEKTILTNSPKEKRKVFIPPTVDEVFDYCHSRQNGINAIQFVSFYESKGWMIGKNKMKDWKAAVRTWENKRKQETVADNNSNNTDNDYWGDVLG